MNGIHDLGGMHGFKFAKLVRKEPVFKHDWEEDVVSAVMAYASPWSIDESRFTIESIPPTEYLTVPYYARWLRSVETLLVKYGVANEQELANPAGPIGKISQAKPWDAEKILEALDTGWSARRDAGKAARFRVGDQIVVKNEHPKGHTRAPRYVRGRKGTIQIDHGVFVFPDSNAKGEGDEQPQHCYNVVFDATELWGSVANPNDRVFVDLFDDYLNPAS